MLPTFIALPLLLVLATCIVIELRTQLIKDAITLPSIAYFLGANLIAGRESALSYIGAGVFVAVAATLFGVVIPRRFCRGEWLGMGAVKLLVATAVAAGGPYALIIVGLYTALALLALGVTAAMQRRTYVRAPVPSSPLLTLAVLFVIVIH